MELKDKSLCATYFSANFNDEVVEGMPPEVQTGIYFGWAKLDTEGTIRKAVVSVGWNPYFKNKKKSFVSLLCLMLLGNMLNDLFTMVSGNAHHP